MAGLCSRLRAGGTRLHPESVTAWLLFVPLAGCVAAFILVPVCGTFFTSLYRDISFLPRRFVGLRQYTALAGDPRFWQALRFTLVFSGVAVGLELVFGLSFALLLNEPLPGRTLLRALVLIPWAIPTIVSAKIWKLVCNYSYGALNQVLLSSGLTQTRIDWFGTAGGAFWAIVAAEVWKTTPFMTLILLAGLQAIPGQMYEQARIDGAGLLQRFRHITLPLLGNIMLVALIFRTIDSMRIFDLVFVLTGGGPGGSTVTLSMLGFERYANDAFGAGSAVSTVTFGIVFFITLLYVRRVRLGEQE